MKESLNFCEALFVWRGKKSPLSFREWLDTLPRCKGPDGLLNGAYKADISQTELKRLEAFRKANDSIDVSAKLRAAANNFKPMAEI